MLKLILFILAAVISFGMTPLVRRLAIKWNAIDVPKDARRIHKKPIPRMGGLAVYISFIIVMVINIFILNLDKGKVIQLVGIMIGATVIVIGGIIDDIKDLKPWQKMCFQITACIIVILSGVEIKVLTNPFSTGNTFLKLSLWIGIPFTIIWIFGITNSINLIDGLDGLAAGVSLIFCITIFVIAIIFSRENAMYMAIILGGGILGFLPYNFNPASIFIGDTGSQLLGFLLATMSIEGAIKSAAAFTIVVPILALGLPIYDTLFAIIRRKVNGKPIMQGDRGHLHHRLLDMGFSQRQAVIIMYLISAILGVLAIFATQLSSQVSYVLLIIVIIIFLIAGWKYGFFEHRE